MSNFSLTPHAQPMQWTPAQNSNNCQIDRLVPARTYIANASELLELFSRRGPGAGKTAQVSASSSCCELAIGTCAGEREVLCEVE